MNDPRREKRSREDKPGDYSDDNIRRATESENPNQSESDQTIQDMDRNQENEQGYGSEMDECESEIPREKGRRIEREIQR